MSHEIKTITLDQRQVQFAIGNEITRQYGKDRGASQKVEVQIVDGVLSATVEMDMYEGYDLKKPITAYQLEKDLKEEVESELKLISTLTDLDNFEDERVSEIVDSHIPVMYSELLALAADDIKYAEVDDIGLCGECNDVFKIITAATYENLRDAAQEQINEWKAKLESIKETKETYLASEKSEEDLQDAICDIRSEDVFETDEEIQNFLNIDD